MSHHENGAEHVHDLVKDQRTAMLTTVHDASGTLASRPMACQRADPDGTLWFLAFADSEKTEEIRRSPQVNVAFTEEGTWVSVTGRASVLQDPARARERWNPFAEAWFQGEPEDERVVVIRVDGDSAEYWDSRGRVGTLVGVLKAKVTGDQPDEGENETVAL
ncbi:pyridoxamine 5'-phosphate oxidase family protein [Oryzobacter telluris]|uniref:pyridoxamine 5'-phosphate oxidase family protein n=1 Tax=Oryzobacter telluris TaxID=3149179 RepID=UPI00370DAD5A